jgi:hypothetical protein
MLHALPKVSEGVAVKDLEIRLACVSHYLFDRMTANNQPAGPRIIKIRYNCNDGPGPIDLVHRVKCRATIPAMLHVNAEAREVAHKTYKPLFAQNLGHPIFFDLDNDFAYFEDENAFEAWTGWNYVKHFDENDPSHFRWELRNIIVHSSILRIMNLLGIVKSPLRVMRSLSKLFLLRGA